MTALTPEQSKYLQYTLTYDGEPYTASADSLSIGLPHATGSNRKNVTVKVTYVQPENAADLPQEAVTVNLAAALDYSQDE